MKNAEKILESHEYHEISLFYGNRVAKRSQVPLMNHINEGILILDLIDVSLNVMKAWCLHPMIQDDKSLVLSARGHAFPNSINFSAMPMLFAMEYRAVANAYLAKNSFPNGGIKLGPLAQTRQLLIADKVQNRKDFELYHKATHPNSERLTAYFNEWCEALTISEPQYQRMIRYIKERN